MAERVAIIFGVTGITGRAIAEQLLADGGWTILGTSRTPPEDLPGVRHLGVDLLDGAAVHDAVAGLAPTHAFYCAWMQHADGAEKVRLNAAMLSSALDAARAGGRLQHAALVTGLSHYMGGANEAPYTEDQPRGTANPFYHALEDVLFAKAAASGFTWSIARPGTILGYAPGNAMNLGTSVAVYATLCRETGRPFVFPGAPYHHAQPVDATDARLLARHMIWEATTAAAADKAFNVVNGDLFVWKTLWAEIADRFRVTPAPYPGTRTHLASALAGAGPDWDRIVVRFGLRPTSLHRIARFDHMDLDTNRERASMADMTRSRELGFLTYQSTRRTFSDLFDRLQAERIVP